MAYVKQKYPNLNIDNYSYDAYELMEVVGAEKARQHGYDALYANNEREPSLNEVVLLTNNFETIDNAPLKTPTSPVEPSEVTDEQIQGQGEERLPQQELEATDGINEVTDEEIGRSDFKDLITIEGKSYKGLELKYSPSKRNEASQEGNTIVLGDKFFDLEADARISVLNHEVSHITSDEIIKTDFDGAAKDGLFITMKEDRHGNMRAVGTFGDVGSSALSETLADSVSLYFNNPEILKERNPEGYKYIDNFIKGKTIPSTERTAEEITTSSERETLDPDTDIIQSEPATPESVSSKIVKVDPKTIKFDPKTYQFKMDVDPKTGVGKGLDIEKWDEILAGVVLLHQKLNGDLYVVNGHHRARKALELGVDSIDVRIVREADGYTDQDAKLLGAKVNIAEGHGSITDAAKLFRDGGYTLEQLKAEGLPMKSGNAQKGYAIAQLTDNLFNKVVDKVITENQGAIIGEKIPSDGGINDARQEFIIKQLMNKDMTNRVLEETLDAIKNTEASSYSQETLFGSELVWNTADYEIKPKVISETKRIISSDKNAFSKIVRNAESLKRVGNVLQDDANVEQKNTLEQAIELIDKMKYAKGDAISDVFSKYTAHVQAGGSVKDAGDRAAKEIIDLISDGEYLNGLMGKAPKAEAVETDTIPGQASLFGEEPVQAEQTPITEPTKGGETSGEAGISQSEDSQDSTRVPESAKTGTQADEGRNLESGEDRTGPTAVRGQDNTKAQGRQTERDRHSDPKSKRRDAQAAFQRGISSISETTEQEVTDARILSGKEVPSSYKNALSDLKRDYGLDTYIYDSKSALDENGFVVDGYIFIRNGVDPYWVYGHEMAHVAKKIVPEIFDSILKAVAKLTKKQVEGYLSLIDSESYKQLLRENQDMLIEEMIADQFGNVVAGTNYKTYLSYEQVSTVEKAFPKIIESLKENASKVSSGIALSVTYPKQTAETRKQIRDAEKPLERINRGRYIQHMEKRLQEVIDDPDYFDRDFYIQSLQNAIEEAKEEQNQIGSVPKFSVRELPPPKNTIKAYKLFRVDSKNPGKLFPLFVDANTSVPLNVWLDAEEGPSLTDSKGNIKVKSKLGNLAYRPGWHLADIPLATHIGVKGNSGRIEYMNPNHVWAEAEGIGICFSHI